MHFRQNATVRVQPAVVFSQTATRTKSERVAPGLGAADVCRLQGAGDRISRIHADRGVELAVLQCNSSRVAVHVVFFSRLSVQLNWRWVFCRKGSAQTN